MNVTSVKAKVGNHEITIETGKMAKQADGAVLVSCGDSKVLVTVVSSTRESTLDFFPLTVEYQERFYAAGKIPGGFFKREGKPSTESVLTCRLIDRPLRPKFPEGYRQETQVVATALSTDGKFPLATLAGIGASTAFHISNVPFDGPVGYIEVGRVDGNYISNPTPEQREEGDLELFIAATPDGILMVEGESDFVSEADVLGALKFAHSELQTVFNAQNELREKVGREKRAFEAAKPDEAFQAKAYDFLTPKIKDALAITEKMARYAAVDEAKKLAETTLLADVADENLAQFKKELGGHIGDIKYKVARDMAIKEDKRIDGRPFDKVRQITTEVGMLPRAHGSGLFTRGETQVLGVVTLGTGDDAQTIDGLNENSKRHFLLHYNFPPFCVGEAGRMGGQSRREIGHGMLAERSLKKVLPSQEEFPYVIRVVSEVLESNGSSSMGTVCSGSMAMQDAGVPIKGNVSGVAMGLIKEGDDYKILTDILGDEDHLGDMDFKVAGTREGITALQMDIKIDSVTFDIMEKALAQAKDGRIHILDEMEKTISTSRGEVSEYAPRIETMKVHPDKIREIIGAGGKVIKGIIEETGAKIEIQDDGTVKIASTVKEAREKAKAMIEEIIAEAEEGKTYKGKIMKITDFGAFVEILPNTSGLLHISEIAHERIRSVDDVLKVGEELDVKVLEVDRYGKIKLSRKALLERPEAN